jgi:putative resolvase
MKNKTKPIESFYLTKELAEKLRVCEMTIYRYIKSGKLNAYKLGKEFRITENSYQSFLKDRKY